MRQRYSTGASSLVPLGRNPLTLTTTFTLPPEFMLDGVIGTTTGSLDLSEGLDAEVGVLARVTCGDPGFNAMSSNNSIQQSSSMRDRLRREIYMKTT